MRYPFQHFWFWLNYGGVRLGHHMPEYWPEPGCRLHRWDGLACTRCKQRRFVVWPYWGWDAG